MPQCGTFCQTTASLLKGFFRLGRVDWGATPVSLSVPLKRTWRLDGPSYSWKTRSAKNNEKDVPCCCGASASIGKHVPDVFPLPATKPLVVCFSGIFAMQRKIVVIFIEATRQLKWIIGHSGAFSCRKRTKEEQIFGHYTKGRQGRRKREIYRRQHPSGYTAGRRGKNWRYNWTIFPFSSGLTLFNSKCGRQVAVWCQFDQVYQGILPRFVQNTHHFVGESKAVSWWNCSARI